MKRDLHIYRLPRVLWALWVYEIRGNKLDHPPEMKQLVGYELHPLQACLG